jgi:hypothetical protein
MKTIRPNHTEHNMLLCFDLLLEVIDQIQEDERQHVKLMLIEFKYSHGTCTEEDWNQALNTYRRNTYELTQIANPSAEV